MNCLTLLRVPVTIQALALIIFASSCFGSDRLVSVTSITGLPLLSVFKRVIFGHTDALYLTLKFVLSAPIVFIVWDFVGEIGLGGSL